MIPSFRIALPVSCTLLLAAGPASAQPAPAQPTLELRTIVIEGESGDDAGGVADPAPVEGYVADEATTGSKTAAPIAEIPQSVSVIGREELDDRAVQKVDEALRYTAGVFAQPFGYDSDTDWAYVRGFDATQSGMYLDGLQLYQYAFAGIIVDPFLVDRIEVLRGPASVLYGGSNAGGLVNSVSKRADGERIRYLETGITDEPNAYLGFDIGDKVAETPWSYRVTGRIKGGETQTDQADNFRGVIAPSLLFEPDEQTRLEVYGSYQYDDQRHVGGFWPYVGTVVAAPYGYVPRDLYYSEPEIDTFEHEQASLGFDFEHEVSDALTLRSNTRWIHLHRKEEGPYVYDFDTTDETLYRLNFAHDTTADVFESDNQAVFDFATGSVSHELLAGLDYKFYRIDQWQASGSAEELDPRDPQYTNDVTLGDPYLDDTTAMHGLGVYVQDQMKFGGGWIVTLNGRYDEVWLDRDDHLGTDDYDGQYGAFSGRAGLAYSFGSGLTPYVSISRFFNPQVGTDQSGQAVKPLEGEQFEVGLKYMPTWMRASFTASVFDLTRRNNLQSVYDGGIGGYVYSAIGEIRSRGIELEAVAHVTESLKLTAAFTAYDLEITDDIDASIVGNQPYLVPEVLASIWADYTIRGGRADGLGFGIGLRYQGESYADNANTLTVPDATLMDAAIHYDRDNWGVALNVDNVFDEEYVSGCQGAYTCNYGEGRTAQLTAHIRF